MLRTQPRKKTGAFRPAVQYRPPDSVIGPIAETYPGAIGVVRAITCEGHVYRYVVEFEDGRTDTFFGFELRHAEKGTATNRR